MRIKLIQNNQRKQKHTTNQIKFYYWDSKSEVHKIKKTKENLLGNDFGQR
jgi:hypothetical protein